MRNENAKFARMKNNWYVFIWYELSVLQTHARKLVYLQGVVVKLLLECIIALIIWLIIKLYGLLNYIM